MLKVFNTLSGRKEEFKPLEEGRARIYVCGPTVYDVAHLGHARTYIAFDVIVRYLEHLGLKVFYVRNITDVGHLTEETAEDKILVGARRERLEPMELVDKYIKEFLEDMDSLGIRRPNIQPRATGHIVEIIEATKKLIEKGYAYVVDGTVYYDVSKFEGYGKLSKIRPEELVRHRIEPDPRKRNPADFALWKRAEPGHILRWASPWGEGYPGWHIECSVMGMKYLGEQFDIHGGARDLVFPHHENEIAQSEALTGKPFVRYWLHTGFLTIEGQKMAKSLGNFIPVKEMLKRWDPEVFRFFVLSSHYRSPIDYSEDSMRKARDGLERLYRALESVDELEAREGELTEAEQELRRSVEELRKGFVDAMNDDFNTPLAISHLFGFASKLSKFASENESIAEKLAMEIRNALGEIGSVLGILQRPRVVDERVRGLVELVIELRQRFRERGEFEVSDAIRKRLGEFGISVEDLAKGVRWRIER
jgi:cysteinyl-tRNA synthetase